MQTMTREQLFAQRIFLKDEIVDQVSRMIKDHDQPVVKGMTEIPHRYILSLDEKLFKLQEVENQINHPK